MAAERGDLDSCRDKHSHILSNPGHMYLRSMDLGCRCVCECVCIYTCLYTCNNTKETMNYGVGRSFKEIMETECSCRKVSIIEQ